MNRFVRRSTIVAVALATTLSAGVALAANTGFSSELLKAGLTSTSGDHTSFASALKMSSFSNPERFSRTSPAASQSSEFAALKSSSLGAAGVGNVPLGGSYSSGLHTALTAQGGSKTSFGAAASECEMTPAKFANVGTALRDLSGEPALASEAPSFASALRRSEMAGAFGGFKQMTGGDMTSPASFAAIHQALINDGTSNTSFSALQTSDIAGLKAALNGSDDASGALTRGTSATLNSAALRKR